MYAGRRPREVTLLGDRQEVRKLTQLDSLILPLAVIVTIGWTNAQSKSRLRHMPTNAKTTTEVPMPQILFGPDELGGPDGARVFTGADHGDVPISLFMIDGRPGSGPTLHRHPYPELFVVHTGRAEFQVDGERVQAAAGDLLVAPAGSAHRFTNVGTGRLRLTAIHTAARMETEWLATEQAT
jgi:mannose-6-phosphate isomerase-like protein (cupin superfamily)